MKKLLQTLVATLLLVDLLGTAALASLFGLDFLPSTGAQTAGGLLLGAALALAGALILRRAMTRRRI